MLNDVEFASAWQQAVSVASTRGSCRGRILFAANVPEMFRDFLNPFGDYFRGQGWKVDATARGIAGAVNCQQHFDNLWNTNWSRDPWQADNIRALRTFRNTVERVGYDLVHVHTPVPGFLTRCAVARLPEHKRPRIMYTVHGFHFHPRGSRLKNQAFLALEKMAGRWTDCLIVINKADQAAALRHRLVPPDKLIYMPGIGIEQGTYSPGNVPEAETARFRREIGVSVATPLVVMLAEFAPGKRHRDALKAFASMKHRSPHLILAGEGPLMADMARLSMALGISDRVHFLGFRLDVPVILRSAGMTILPSEREGLPRSIMEALNMGVPVIGSDVRGIDELLAEGAGLLVPLGDTNRLAEAMDWVLDHPVEAKELGNVGAARMDRYARAHIFKLHEQLYSKILGGQPLQ